jgi:nicotinamidase/pyrazinamidase
MKVLLLVDIQNDFLPGGALAVTDGDQIIPVVNQLIPKFELIVATQDWHPQEHGSFASNHSSRKPGELIQLNGLTQVLWPDHCVQNTFGAAFSQSLNTNSINTVFVRELTLALILIVVFLTMAKGMIRACMIICSEKVWKKCL